MQLRKTLVFYEYAGTYVRAGLQLGWVLVIV